MLSDCDLTDPDDGGAPKCCAQDARGQTVSPPPVPTMETNPQDLRTLSGTGSGLMKIATITSHWSFTVQLLSCVRLFATPWTAARQPSPSITNSWSLLKLMSIESVMPSNHLILCHPLLLPSIFPNIRVFFSESVGHIRWPKYWSFEASVTAFQ